MFSPQAEQLIKDFQTRVSQRNTPRRSTMALLERGLSVVDGSNTSAASDRPAGSEQSSVVKSPKGGENGKGIYSVATFVQYTFFYMCKNLSFDSSNC